MCLASLKILVWRCYHNRILMACFLREDSFIDFVPGTFRGVGILLLYISVKMEIIDFHQSRIKQKLQEKYNYTRKMCNMY